MCGMQLLMPPRTKLIATSPGSCLDLEDPGSGDQDELMCCLFQNCYTRFLFYFKFPHCCYDCFSSALGNNGGNHSIDQAATIQRALSSLDATVVKMLVVTQCLISTSTIIDGAEMIATLGNFRRKRLVQTKPWSTVQDSSVYTSFSLVEMTIHIRYLSLPPPPQKKLTNLQLLKSGADNAIRTRAILEVNSVSLMHTCQYLVSKYFRDWCTGNVLKGMSVKAQFWFFEMIRISSPSRVQGTECMVSHTVIIQYCQKSLLY